MSKYDLYNCIHTYTPESFEVKREVIEHKRLRKEIDEKIQALKYLPPSRERSISITKLQEAVMWLGMDLKRLGTENPYPSSKDPTTGTKIEPTADGLKLQDTKEDYQILVDTIRRMGWRIAVKESDALADPIRGLIIGEDDYVDSILY